MREKLGDRWGARWVIRKQGILWVMIGFILQFFNFNVAYAGDREIEIDRLLGSHRMVLNWLGLKNSGFANIIEAQGELFINGYQENEDGDSLFIQGKIVDASKNTFVFDGTVITRVSKINGGQSCVRQGPQTFKRQMVNQKYWRMQEALNPCTQIEQDYIDIYLHE